MIRSDDDLVRVKNFVNPFFLEHLDRRIGPRLLETIPAENILVSFPVRSLGGREKGMAVNYEQRFQGMIAGSNWQVQRFEFPTELAFLLTR